MSAVLPFPTDTYTPVLMAIRELERCTELVRLAYETEDDVLQLAALSLADSARSRLFELKERLP